MIGHSESGRVLVVEDEQNLARGIAENLEAEGLHVEIRSDGRSGLDAMVAADFDLVVLDVMLPEMDGFTVCEIARARGCNAPVLFLTARGDARDRIRGLEAGADDYLAKPFHLKELLLRVRAILRRARPERRVAAAAEEAVPESVEFGGNRVDFRSFTAVAWDGEAHTLTEKEVGILRLFSARENQVVSRDAILDAVWGEEAFPSSRTIDNFVLRLRKRFEREPDSPRHFHTVRGVGYRFSREAGRS